MNAVTKTDPKPMLLDFMADKAGLRPDEFSATVRATCGMIKASAEEFAAFLMVAREYNLNPLTKEIYAFPAKGGGIVPIVSIDGWVNLVNSHPACNGFEFDVEHDAEGELVSITCRMYRKDRDRPVAVTEFYEECKRATDPWKMKHRMLRHKAMIQAARYAFGFSGIYDEDEGAKIAEMRDITPKAPPAPPKPPAPPSAAAKSTPAPPSAENSADDIVDAEVIDRDTGEVTDDRVIDGEVVDASDEPSDEGQSSDNGGHLSVDEKTDAEKELEALAALDAALAKCTNALDIVEVWNEHDILARFDGNDDVITAAKSYKRKHAERVKKNG